ncbi:MAG TPA: hypothetical protein DEH78_08580 [Solibacterales bacterium]|nr:hypothetical protein [Bryobacterales bacterium]
MRVYVEAMAPGCSGRVWTIAEGEVASFGSGHGAEHSIDDSAMKEVHFLLTGTSKGPVLHALAPVSINDRETEGGALEHLDWILAGATLFRVWLDGEPPPDEPETVLDRAAAILSSQAPVLAVVDPAMTAAGAVPRDAGVPLHLTPADRLPEGTKLTRIPREAPVLFSLGGPERTSQFLHAVWGRDCAVFVSTQTPIDILRPRLLRYLFTSVEERGIPWPYHSPRFLRLALEGTGNPFAADFFSIIERVWVESASPWALSEMSPNGEIEHDLRGEFLRSRLPQQAELRAATINGRSLELAREEDTRAGRRLGLRSDEALAQFAALRRDVGDAIIAEALRESPFEADSALDLFALALNRDRWEGPSA